MAQVSGSTSADTSNSSKDRPAPQMEELARQLALQVQEQLPGILQTLQEGGFDPDSQPLQLECSLTAGNAGVPTNNRLPVAALSIGRDLTPFSNAMTPRSHSHGFPESYSGSLPMTDVSQPQSPSWNVRLGDGPISPEDSDSRPNKRRKDARRSSRPSNDIVASTSKDQSPSNSLVRRDDGQRKKRVSDNPALQPSTFDKFISGVWESIYSGLRMDPTEVIEQWQAIESSGQPKLLTDTEHHIAVRDNNNTAFGRINVLTRKISQTSRACRSLEVIVQAHWIQCFEDRVNELAQDTTREKAKRAAIAEACVDFNWTEKELRNKMAIWRGYHDIKTAGGWVALVFAGMGLYRFCKYRVSFTEETFDNLRALRHRFEVAADTLHPRWRIMLGIVGESGQVKYRGHPHDWVVNGPGNEAIPLPETYRQWDRAFSYRHLDSSTVDEEAWPNFDPRTVILSSDPSAYKCEVCNEQQSNDPTRNGCQCYPNYYGSPKSNVVPLQVFRTANGKNNGLVACREFEKGWAVGEFIGLITYGLEGTDVMWGETENAKYQIWQGREGNHTRFVNHSCQPNSHWERFVWLGKQRTVLASKGIPAGEEVTVDYGYTYWENLDKECMCGQPGCRYRDRSTRQLITPPDDRGHNDEET